MAARQFTTHAGPDTCHRNENNFNHGQETKDLVLMQFMQLNLQNIDMYCQSMMQGCRKRGGQGGHGPPSFG